MTIYVEAIEKVLLLHCCLLRVTYCVVLYYVLLYCVVLYYVLLYCVVLYYVLLYCVVLYCTSWYTKGVGE